MKPSEVGQTIRLLEKGWKDTCGVLNRQEKVLVETYLGFLRRAAKTCLEKGWRVWFKPNQVVHWGEGGFGYLSILLPAGEPETLPDLPGEVRFIADLSDEKTLGEEITLATIEQITYEADRWL
ncbi:MAG: hypothetical protein ACE5JU_21645 [Candidatus Binatia bacterium]